MSLRVALCTRCLTGKAQQRKASTISAVQTMCPKSALNCTEPKRLVLALVLAETRAREAFHVIQNSCLSKTRPRPKLAPWLSVGPQCEVLNKVESWKPRNASHGSSSGTRPTTARLLGMTTDEESPCDDEYWVALCAGQPPPPPPHPEV